MSDWTDGLPTMDLDTLRPVFGELVQIDANRQLHDDRKHVRRSDRKVLLDARRLQNCLTHIGRLPEPAESYHLVVAKKYSLWESVASLPGIVIDMLNVLPYFAGPNYTMEGGHVGTRRIPSRLYRGNHSC